MLSDWLVTVAVSSSRPSEKILSALVEAVLPALRGAGKAHADVDVRLRAASIAAALEKELYGEVRRFTGHAEGFIWFALSPDGKRMISGCWGGQVDYVARVWEVGTGKELM